MFRTRASDEITRKTRGVLVNLEHAFLRRQPVKGDILSAKFAPLNLRPGYSRLQSGDQPITHVLQRYNHESNLSQHDKIAARLY